MEPPPGGPPRGTACSAAAARKGKQGFGLAVDSDGNTEDGMPYHRFLNIGTANVGFLPDCKLTQAVEAIWLSWK